MTTARAVSKTKTKAAPEAKKAAPAATRANAAGARAVASTAHGITKLDLDLLPTTIGYFLRRLQGAYKDHFLQSTPGLDLGPKDVPALFVVGRNPGISPRQFGAAMALDGAMTSLLLSALERRGLLTREKSINDGRGRTITLTKEGAAMLTKLRRTVARVDSDFTSSLSENERAQLLGLMARLWASRAGVSVPQSSDPD